MKTGDIINAMKKGNPDQSWKVLGTLIFIANCRIYAINDKDKDEIENLNKLIVTSKQMLKGAMKDDAQFSEIEDSFERIFNLSVAQMVINFYSETYNAKDEKPDMDKIFKMYDEAKLGDLIAFKHEKIINLFLSLDKIISGHINKEDGYKDGFNKLFEKIGDNDLKNANELLVFSEKYQKDVINDLENKFRDLCVYIASIERDINNLGEDNSKLKKIKNLLSKWLEIRNKLFLQKLIIINHVIWQSDFDIEMAQSVIRHGGNTKFKVNKKSVKSLKETYEDLWKAISDSKEIEDHLLSVESHINDYFANNVGESDPKHAITSLEQKVWYRLIRVLGLISFGLTAIISIIIWWNTEFDSEVFTVIFWVNFLLYIFLMVSKKLIVYVVTGER